MAITKDQDKAQAGSKDQRLRDLLFPDSADAVFQTSGAGFVPLPILYRKLLRHLTPPQLRVLVYLHTRASKYAICYPPPDEMAHDLGFSSKKKVTPHIKALLEMKFISSKTSSGRAVYLIHHPRVAAIHLRVTGAINSEDAFEIDELLKDLKQPAIEWDNDGATK